MNTENRNATRAHSLKHGHAKRGLQSPEYNTWRNIKKRCFNPNNPKFPDYGGRGITICSEWRDSFAAFLRDMKLRPQGYSIHRIDNDGNYEPGNCRWASRNEQDRNKRNSHYLEFDGQRKVLADWAKELGMDKGALLGKLKKGHTLEELFTLQTPMAA